MKLTSEIENDIIEPLATTLRNSDYNLEVAVKQLLKSQHFFDADDGVFERLEQARRGRPRQPVPRDVLGDERAQVRAALAGFG